MTTIRLKSYATTPTHGWVRCTTDHWQDSDLVPTVLELGKVKIVPGRKVGNGVRMIDVCAKLEPTEGVEIKLEDAQAYYETPYDQFDPEQVAKMVPVPVVDRVALEIHSARRDGAHTLIEWRNEDGLTVVFGWVAVDEPWLLQGEVIFYGPPEQQWFAMDDIALSFPNGICALDGLQFRPLLARGEKIADGQCRAYRFSCLFAQHLLGQSPIEWQTADAKIRNLLNGYGLNQLYPTLGNPRQPALDPVAWVNSKTVPTRSALNGYSTAGVGVAATSGVTGAQEDQFFVGAEMVHLPGGHWPRYYAALGQFRRPCHFLEANGEHLDLNGHPQLVMWDSRPHYDPRVSPDQLGRSFRVRAADASGWFGPDEEHLLFNSVFVAARATGSFALQRLMEHQAINWMFSKTVDPKLSTSRPGAARAVGYECWAAWLLWHGLERRDLAERVLERSRQRVDLVLLPKLQAKVQKDGVWDARKDDPRLGQGRYWMPWQQAVGSFGLSVLADLLKHGPAQSFAMEAANTVCGTYFQDGNKWRAPYSLSLDGFTNNMSDYSDFGCPLAVGVIGDNELRESLLKHGSGKWTVPSLWEAK